MAKVATRSLPRYALAAGIIALLALGLLYLRGELILWKINTLESSVEGFVGTPSCEPPSWVPENVSYVINSGLWEVTRSYHGAEGLTRRVWLTLGSGYSELYLTNIVYLHPGFEEALGRFSNLTGVTVWFSYDSSSLSEQDARKVCEVLRTMPYLEWVELKGPHFSDTALAALSGHPHIKTLILPSAGVTRASIPTFHSLPALESVVLPPERDDVIINFKEVAVIQKALPWRVNVKPPP